MAMNLKMQCLELAVKNPEVSYDQEGKPKGPDANKVVKMAQKYYDFLKGK